MTDLQLLMVCLTFLTAVAIVAAAVVLVARRPDAHADTAPVRVGHRATIHTKRPDDQTLFGVIVGDYEDRLVLDDAELVTSAGAHPLPGRQDIAPRDISWIDVHALVADATQLARTSAEVVS